MKNPASHIRKSMYELLSGQVSYNATPVPVYSSEGVPNIPYQINIMEYSDADNSNRHTFGATAAQVIEIVAEQSTSSRLAVDAIGELVMDKIQHAASDVGTLSDSDFEVFTQERPSMSYLTENSGEGSKIVRLILRYNLLINEKSY